MNDNPKMYDIRISLIASDIPTDLELGDLCLHLTTCLESPVVESADGSFVPADYFFEAWQLELFEASGDRVWMYASNAELLPNDSLAVREDAGLPRRAGMIKRMLYWMASVRY